MRDPKRIDKVMEAIRTLWIKNPDLRFFQLIEMLPEKINGKSIDLFFMEDEEILKRLNAELKLMTPAEWCQKFHLHIIDADGWHDKDFGEPISENEFYERACDSTCCGKGMSLLLSKKK